MSRDSSSPLVCPVPLEPGDRIQLAHGGGGRLTARLIERVLVPAFDNPQLSALDDGATLEVAGERLAYTTDSFVVTPPFFPGGDIGSLSIYGTANDLAMCGADPLFFSAGLILEEGFPIPSLEQIVASMAAACRRVGAPLVTGDTKVVDRGKGDGIFINTSGVGRVRKGVSVSSRGARPGDVVLVSGPVGDHGIAVMARREGIALKTELGSDCAPVWPLVAALLDAAPDVRALRDPTRGGLATALCEIAAASGVGMDLQESAIPVRETVRGACELLGLDPLYVACEGRFLAVVPRERGEAALLAVRALPNGASAALIGEVTETRLGAVRLRTPLGSYRVLERQSGEQLPRIC